MLDLEKDQSVSYQHYIHRLLTKIIFAEISTN